MQSRLSFNVWALVAALAALGVLAFYVAWRLLGDPAITAKLPSGARMSLWLQLGVGLGAGALAAGSGLWLRLRLLKPLAHLRREVALAARGDLDRPLAARSMVYELQDLANQFAALLEHQRALLQQERERARTARRAHATMLDALEDSNALARERRALVGTLEEKVRTRTAAFEAANWELKTLSYSLSHDLRAPLRGIDGFAQILLEDVGDRLLPAESEHLTRIRSASQHMGNLLDEFGRYLSLAQEPRRDEQVNLSGIALEIVNELAKGDPKRRAEWAIAPGLFAWGDRRLLQVVLDNLLGNAFKFTGRTQSPTIELGSHEKAGETVYFVKDNGAGFEMAYVEKLFTPFQRLHAAEQFAGSGMGLALVRQIVARHGGKVWAEAKPDEGATFFFTLGGQGGGLP